MAQKTPEAQGARNFYSQVPFPISRISPSPRPARQILTVRSPERIPRKVLNYFKFDVKTGLRLSEDKQIFMAQVFMHEIDEGIEALERFGRSEQARLLRSSKMHPNDQMQLLREWLDQEPVRSRPPERVQDRFKIRNNQNGEISALFPHGRVGGVTSQGILYKDRNEDAMFAFSERGILAVADGMGGHVGGNIASGILIDFLEYALKTGKGLEEAIVFANEAVIQRTRSDRRLGGMTPMGTTLTCCEIRGDRLKSLHVGDSKLLVIRRSEVIHSSQDHTNGQDLLREGLVDQETAHYLNHILSRSLGCDSIFANRDLEKTETMLKPGDRVLLATDGITDNFYAADFSLNELAQLADSGRPEEAARKIHDLCVERVRKEALPDGRPSKPDNLTLLLYEHTA